MAIGLAIGAGMGLLLSIAAGNDVFMAVGLAIGAGIGVTFDNPEETEAN